MRGRIRVLNPDRGFGFILPLDDTREHFFHNSEMAAGAAFHELRLDGLIEFDSVWTAKGARAVNLRLVPDAEGGA